MAQVAALSLVASMLLAASIADAQTPARTVVAAADYPEGVRFIEADERAFLDPTGAGVAEPGEPLRLDVAPVGFVPRLEVRSGLWGRIAAGLALPAVEAIADYDTQTATVRLRHLDGTASWWALDEARASLLTRYARIGRGGRTGTEPTTLQVLREMRRWRESVVIDVEGFEIGPRRWDQRLLWAEFERAIALEVTPADLEAASATVATVAPVARPFAGEAPPEGIRVTFRLLDGRALPFVYLPEASLLVDVTRVEAEAARAASLPAFEVSPSVAITLERIVATEGVPLADGANERLADGGDGVAALEPRASSVAVRPVAAAPVAPPAPRAVRSFNEAVAVVVSNVEGEASMFVVMLLAVAAASAAAGAAVGRRASR